MSYSAIFLSCFLPEKITLKGKQFCLTEVSVYSLATEEKLQCFRLCFDSFIDTDYNDASLIYSKSIDL